MSSPGILDRVALVKIDVSEEFGESIIWVKIIGELRTKLAVTSNRSTPRHPDDGGANFSEKTVFTRATRRNIQEEDIPHSHRRENLKSYIALTGWTL
jgi:hypothetical protein